MGIEVGGWGARKGPIERAERVDGVGYSLETAREVAEEKAATNC